MSLLIEVHSLLISMHSFFLGATFALSMTASLLFLRFYRRTSDRIFVYFFAAFAILGINRAIFAMGTAQDEYQTLPYLIRLAAFGLILYAIVDKNRGQPADAINK